MHAVQIVASIASEAAGPSYSVTRLAAALAAHCATSEVMSVGFPASEKQVEDVSIGSSFRSLVFLSTRAVIPLTSRLAASPALRDAIHRAAAKGAVLHNHGLWLLPNVYPGQAAARHGNPYIFAPRGMLGTAALKFSSAKKRLFWALAQRRALASVSCYHATSDKELEDIRTFGLTGPVAIVPNGIDVPKTTATVASHAVETGGHRTLLHLGRIHPKKGINRLLRAWARLEPAYEDWRLRIVGPSEGGHGEELQTLSARLGLQRAIFEGPVYGAAKQAVYREANLFVLPTLDENFGMVVAEALSNGTPVISTKGAPWQGLEENACGWWIDHGVEPLEATLRAAMETPPSVLDDMGARGRKWMERDFSWDRVAADMVRIYSWCGGTGERPETVVVD